MFTPHFASVLSVDGCYNGYGYPTHDDPNRVLSLLHTLLAWPGVMGVGVHDGIHAYA